MGSVDAVGGAGAAGPARTVVEHDLDVPMRDGVRLRADLYRPEGAGPLPTLVRRTPYGRSGAPGGRSVDGLRLARSGYNVLVQDVRGRFGSGGRFRPFRHEADDGADTVRWAAARPWCDGTVGLFGRSYEGMAALLAAGQGPEELGAVVPHVAADGYREGFTHQGGAFQLGFCLYWVLYDLLLTGAGAPPDAVAEVTAAIDRIDELYREPWRVRPLLDRLAPWYRDWERPAEDPFWRDEFRYPGPAAVRVPVLGIGGWYDAFLDGTLRTFTGVRERGATAAARTGSALLVGPWAHCLTDGLFPQRRYGVAADEAHVDVTGLHLAFFDRHLKARPGTTTHPWATGDDPDGPVRLFVTGADAWRTVAGWPVPGAGRTVLHAGGGGVLTAACPPAAGSDPLVHHPGDPVPTTGGATALPGMFVGSDCGPLDQRDVERRPDVLCYTTAPLARPLTVAGPVRLHAFVSAGSSGAGEADLTGKLVDVSPDGRAELLCDGVVRTHLDAAPGPAAPDPGREPGAGVPEVELRIGAVAHRFAAGHRIRLEIAASNFPRFAVHPDARHGSVHHGGPHPTRLVLPVLAEPG